MHNPVTMKIKINIIYYQSTIIIKSQTKINNATLSKQLVTYSVLSDVILSTDLQKVQKVGNQFDVNFYS